MGFKAIIKEIFWKDKTEMGAVWLMLILGLLFGFFFIGISLRFGEIFILGTLDIITKVIGFISLIVAIILLIKIGQNTKTKGS